MSDNGAIAEEPKAERNGRRNASRRLPAWVLGLIIATVLFGIGIIVFRALGFGDNPVVGETTAVLRAL